MVMMKMTLQLLHEGDVHSLQVAITTINPTLLSTSLG
jgi:hypothetical protein